MTDWETCDCGTVNNADEYNKLYKEWSDRPQMMYATNPPRYANPPPKFICTNCGEEI